MFAPALVSLALAASALANVFFTSPISSTVYTAGQPANVVWIDSGVGPSLADFGPAECGVFIGNALQQTELQKVTSSVDVSLVSSLTFTPDATVGPESSEYFFRCTSISGTDSKTGYHYQAFSAKFTLVGMSGKFSKAMQDQIDGQSTAPIGGSTSTTASSATTTGTVSATTTSATTTGFTTVSKATTAPTGTAAAAATSATTAPTTNGAGKPVIATGFVALVATLIGASFL